MNNKLNCVNSQGSEASRSHFKRSRVFPPRNKFSNPNHSLSKPNIKPQIKALIDIVPEDQAFIQDYIEELKSKLMQMKLSPNKKNNSPLQNHQRHEQKYYQHTKTKSRPKIMKSTNQIHTTNRSTEFSRKSFTDHKLLDFNQVRDEVKRLKRNVADRRVVTQKQNHRYDRLQQENKYESEQYNSQRQKSKIRSITEEVIRSNKNPARIYRYSSERKTKMAAIDSFKNTFIFPPNSESNYPINKAHLQQKSLQKEARYPQSAIIQKRFSQQRQVTSKIGKRQIENNKVRVQTQKQVNQKIEDLSTIIAKKQTINFLGDSCVAIKEQLQTYKQSTAKLLDFLDWKTKELKDVFLNCKQKKRRWELDKLSKIFPKGFFI